MARFARYPSESQYPELWRELVGFWPTSVGPTGLVLRDRSLISTPSRGTLINMDAGDWVVGEKGYVLDYDGTNDHTLCGNAPVFNITDTVSVSAWVRFERQKGQFRGIFTKMGGTVNGYGLACGTIRTPTQTNMEFKLNGSANGSGLALVDNFIWHHLLGTYDGAVSRLYVDGVEVSSANHVVSISTTTEELTIGALSYATQFAFLGQISDVGVWRIALPGRIAVDMAAGASPLTPRRRRVMKAPAVGIPIPLIMQQMDQYSGGVAL